MSAWLDPVRRALAADGRGVTFFLRDDDAGWQDERLYRLLDVTANAAAPIALAAIPTAIGAELATDLRARVAQSPPLVSVHQHGYAHINHESSGRKSEFGPGRPRHAQWTDLAEGRDRLRQRLGLELPSIFTPPWNRCTWVTAECLVELGFEVLSCDLTAASFRLASLRELSVCLDWSGRRGAHIGLASWGEAIARAIAPGATIGLMLHHAVMTSDDLRQLAELLPLLAVPPHRIKDMTDIAPTSNGHGAVCES
jgi:hypothetical protein